MSYYGDGHCKSGYYGGWDGQGDQSQKDCKSLCLSDTQCKFAAYYVGINNRTCSRYDQKTCQLDTSKPWKKAHQTFAKG